MMILHWKHGLKAQREREREREIKERENIRERERGHVVVDCNCLMLLLLFFFFSGFYERDAEKTCSPCWFLSLGRHPSILLSIHRLE